MNKIVKIVYIIDKLTGNMGGTERQLIEMINGLNKGKFQIHLICFDNSTWFQANASIFKCDSTVIKINHFTKLFGYLNILKLIKFLRNYKPDVVHTFFPAGNIVGPIAARLAGVKNIISSRRDYGEWMNSRYLFATRSANRFVRKIIANSNQVKELTEKKENTNNGKIEVIYNGIDISVFKNLKRDSSLRKSLNIPDNDKVVGIVANFRPMKHHYTFIKAANEILKVRNDIKFILIGAGPMKEDTEKLGHSLGISNKLHFMGSVKASVFLPIIDVGVNCSQGEGLSNAVMEYMTAGIPCVVSNAGGNPDLITNNINGYTFELDDYKTLAALILKLIDDEDARKRFIKNAREKIEREMSLETMLSKYETLYEQMANEK